MGRVSLLAVLAAGVVISVMSLNINRSTTQSVDAMVQYYSRSVARVIANEGMGYVLSKLADSSTLRHSYFKILPTNLFADLGPYSGSYKIIDTSIIVNGASKKVIKLLLLATYLAATESVLVYADSNFGFKPKSIRGAFTANDTINNTISDMVIDGRDHDMNGNLLSNGQGVFGVSTTVPFYNVDRGEIGGTNASGVDIAPKYSEDPSIIEQNYNVAGGFPNTPDGALGYPEGTLKSMALSGVGGSQYLAVATDVEYKLLQKNDPKKLLGLNAPLRGITYVELAPTVPPLEWNGGFFCGSTGILIVHNSSGNARLKGLKQNGIDPPFKGIIIADYIFHIHMNIIGAILLLSTNLEKEANCQANEGHKVSYSNEAVKAATNVMGSAGSGWQGRIPIIAWYE